MIFINNNEFHMVVKWLCTVFQDFPYQVLPQRNRKSLNTCLLQFLLVFSHHNVALQQKFSKSFIWSSIMLVNGDTITKNVNSSSCILTRVNSSRINDFPNPVSDIPLTSFPLRTLTTACFCSAFKELKVPMK